MVCLLHLHIDIMSDLFIGRLYHVYISKDAQNGKKQDFKLRSILSCGTRWQIHVVNSGRHKRTTLGDIVISPFLTWTAPSMPMSDQSALSGNEVAG